MALSVDLIPIESPCPIDLDPARNDPARRSWHCSHCDKRVHVLSNMTEDEARAFLSERDGQNLCVSYLQRPDGTIKFREPRLVPVQALAPRRLALGFGAALAACTPTEPPPKPASPTIEVRTEEATPKRSPATQAGLGDMVQKFKAEVPKTPVEPPPPEPPKVEPEELVPYDGGITARALPPPIPPATPPTVMRRGGLRRGP